MASPGSLWRWITPAHIEKVLVQVAQIQRKKGITCVLISESSSDGRAQ